ALTYGRPTAEFHAALPRRMATRAPVRAVARCVAPYRSRGTRWAAENTANPCAARGRALRHCGAVPRTTASVHRLRPTIPAIAATLRTDDRNRRSQRAVVCARQPDRQARHRAGGRE